jgi:hypothetical protein
VHLLVSVFGSRVRERGRERVREREGGKGSFVRGGMGVMMMTVAPRWRES